MPARKRLAKYAGLFGGYGLGVFLIQGINLILIPIFWRVLTPEDFGIITLTQIITLFLNPIYMFGASETIQRFYYKWPEHLRRDYLSWYVWFILIFTLLLTLILDFLGDRFSHLLILNVKFDPLLRYALWSTFFANFINFPIAISRIQQKIHVYNVLVVGNFVTQTAIVYYLVKVAHEGALGYVKGFFIANAIWFLPTLWMTGKASKFFPDRKHFSLPLRYATPLSFAGLIEGFSTALDRYFLDKFIPLGTIGIYNLSRQFSSLVNIINSVFKLVFVPYIYKINALRNNADWILGHIGLVYAVLMTVPVVGVCTLAPELIRLLDPSGVYFEITKYIPYFALGFYFTSMATVTGRGMDLAGLTSWTVAIPLVGILTSLLIYFYTLPQLGVIGILLSVAISSFVKSLVNIILAIYWFPRKLYIKRLLCGWILALSFYCIISQIPSMNDWLTLFVKLLLLLSLTVLLLRFVLYKNINDGLKKTSELG